MSYRPITDHWMLTRAKLKGGVKYYGSYPGGFGERARALLGVHILDPVLHVCAGQVKNYPYKRAIGPNDKTLDLDPATVPDFVHDAREPFPLLSAYDYAMSRRDVLDAAGLGFIAEFRLALTRLEGERVPWPAILIDPPYTDDDQQHYSPTVWGKRPTPALLLKHALAAVRPGGRVGILGYKMPRPKKADGVVLVASIPISIGFENMTRVYAVYEKAIALDTTVVSSSNASESQPEEGARQNEVEDLASGDGGTSRTVSADESRRDETAEGEGAAEAVSE